MKQIEFMGSETDATANLAVARVLERHRRLGESIVVWRDGQVVEIPADEIPPLDAARLSSTQHAPDERLD